MHEVTYGPLRVASVMETSVATCIQPYSLQVSLVLILKNSKLLIIYSYTLSLRIYIYILSVSRSCFVLDASLLHLLLPSVITHTSSCLYYPHLLLPSLPTPPPAFITHTSSCLQSLPTPVADPGGGLRGLKTPPSARPAMNKLTNEYLIT